mmetsp:Transcript_64077/g.139381  ORF Transcript_64077/g.139381 Transcript_64077/m.139381 type:complete len:452 (+) Transcript_64077:156-1511(+)
MQGRLAVALSCFGLIADFYDIGIINLIRPLLQEEFGALTPAEDGVLTSAALLGAIVGQIGCGCMADRLGRRAIFLSTASLVAFASLGSAFADHTALFGLSMYSSLSLWRFVLGVGIGGEYPLAAAATSENVASEFSTMALAMTYSGMALGCLLAPTVVICLLGPFGLENSIVWRLALGLGSVWAGLVAILRYFHLKETEGWERVASEAPTVTHFEHASALMAMPRTVLGTAGSWLLYDVVAYGVGLFTTEIFPALPGMGSSMVVLLISILGLPFYVGTIFISRFPLKMVQFYGFLIMFFCFLLLASPFSLGNFWFGALVFSLMQGTSSMCPGLSTFAIPGQVYPVRIRGTGHGLSAAAGKLGAVIGTVAFPFLRAAVGMNGTMFFMAFTCVATAVWTWIFTPRYDCEVLDEIMALDQVPSVTEQATKVEALLFAESVWPDSIGKAGWQHHK